MKTNPDTKQGNPDEHSRRHNTKSALGGEKKDLKYIVLTIANALLMAVWVFGCLQAAELVVKIVVTNCLSAATLEQPTTSIVVYTAWYVIALAMLLWINIGHIVNSRKAKDYHIISSTANRSELGLRNWPTWTDIGLSIAGFIVYFFCSAIIVTLFTNFVWFDEGQRQDTGFDPSIVGLDRIIAFLTLVVVAPIMEELIFRGWLYGKMRKNFSKVFSQIANIAISSLLVSLLFGIIHEQWNVGVDVFILSMVACIMRELTGTIHAGILLHMIKNGIAFYGIFVLGLS